MKKIYFLIILFLLAISHNSFAISYGTSEFIFNFDSESYPDLYIPQPEPSLAKYGAIVYRTIDPYGYEYPWDPYGRTFFTSNDYNDNRSDGLSSVSADWYQDNGGGVFSFQALSNDSNKVAEVETAIGFVVHLGNFQYLPDFSYAYQFLGYIDSTVDWLQFGIQLALESGDGVVHYTDYDYNHPSYMTKNVWLNRQGTGFLDVSGLSTFSGYSAQNPVNWYLYVDLYSSGGDRYFGTGNNDPVIPEPTTLSLLGLGLVGLIARKRKKRSV